MKAGLTLPHLSDPHLPPLPERAAEGPRRKARFGYLNWTRNRNKYRRREVLEASWRPARPMGPTRSRWPAIWSTWRSSAEPPHLRPPAGGALALLKRVCIVPGNHDADVRIILHRSTEMLPPIIGVATTPVGLASLLLFPRSARDAGADRLFVRGADRRLGRRAGGLVRSQLDSAWIGIRNQLVRRAGLPRAG